MPSTAHPLAPTSTRRRASRSDPSLRDAAAVAAELGTDLAVGLSTREATERLERDGRNVLASAPPVPRWRKLLRQFQSPLVVLLLIAVVVSAVAWALEGAHGWPVDSVVVLLIVGANAVLGVVQEARAEDAVAALQRLAQATSAVLRDGEVRRIPTDELVRGDVLVLAEGDSVGADARLVEAAQLRVRESALTGESEPERKDETTLQAPAPLGDRSSMVFRGTAVLQGTGRAVVTATGMDTEFGHIARLLTETRRDPTPLEQEISRLGRVLGIAVLVIAAVVVASVVAISGIDSAHDAIAVLLLGVSLAVAAVPEGLPAILSIVLAIGVQRMAARNAIVKALSSVETLGCAAVICSDKTGTLTRGEMTLARLVTASGAVDLGSVQDVTDPALRSEVALALRWGSLAGNATLHEQGGTWDVRGDSTDAAFLAAARQHLGVHEELRRFTRHGEIPFTTERKRVTTFQRELQTGRTILVTKGAPDLLLTRCTHVQVGDAILPLDAARRAALRASIEELSRSAYRTIAVATRELAVVPDPDDPDVTALEDELVLVGLGGIIDPPRPEAAAAVRDAQRAGVRVMMITGDHPLTAARIASDLGIVAPGANVLTGEDLEALDEQGLQAAVRATSVYARVAPEHKLRIVDALQADGTVVAMTGDGVNDAPALKSADIGVAMGIAGTEVTKEAGAMILEDDNFATIVAAVREGRRIFDNIRKFLRYLLCSNMGEVLTVFLGVVLGAAIGLTGADGVVAIPLLATQILWINLVTDAAPALAIGVDPETDDVMARPPRAPTERVIDRRMWVDVVTTGVVTATVALGALDAALPGGLLPGESTLEVARTAGFTTLVFAGLLTTFIARSDRTSAFRHLHTNPWLLGAVALGALLQVAVVHTPFLNAAFGTAPLTGWQWLGSALAATAVLWVSELVKLARRARSA